MSKMQDMTQGPVSKHILTLSAFIAMTTVFQTLYFIADLYFVGRLGKEAIAGVSLGGNLTMLVLALTQSLGVGTTSLLAQALGRKNRDEAELVFNQSLALSIVTGVLFFVVAFALRRVYCQWLGADAATVEMGVQYMSWFVPAMALQFALISMGAAFRGMGDLKHPTLIQIATVVMNIVLAPVLIFGWGTGRPLGVAGAALASFIAILFGCVAFIFYFEREASHLRFRKEQWKPRLPMWAGILKVGLPAGGEFALISVYMILVYDVIRPFGAAAQAGFGIGGRVMQALFLPAVAVAFATSPVVGQNFGARQGERVRQAFYSGAMIVSVIMLVTSLLCHITPEGMVRFFNKDAAVITFGSDYLRIISWNFVASGIIFVSSSVFQGMGYTIPSLASSATRLVLWALPTYLLSLRADFQIKHVWYLSLASVFVQLCLNVWLLHREFRRKLDFPVAVVPAEA